MMIKSGFTRTMMAAALLLAGCAATGGGRIGVGEWRAVDINGVPVSAGKPVTLRVNSGGRISGNAGCNNYFGSYQLSASGRIRFGGIGSTRMHCEPPAAMDQERSYLALLENIQSYSFYGDGSLSLIAADGRAIRYRNDPTRR